MVLVVVNGEIISDDTGASLQIPVLLTPSGPLVPLIDYCLQMRRSLSWMEKLMRAVVLFLEYLEANANQYEEEWRFFRNFSNALRLGTIPKDTRIDPSGLYWEPYPTPYANYVVFLLSEFFDWLGREDGPRAKTFNPHYAGGVYNQRIDERAYLYRRDKNFLGHTWSANPTKSSGRHTRGERTPTINRERPPAFPEEHFEELLFKGFRVAGKYDYRGMLISLLLFGGGLRISEPFHLYMSDVQPYWDDPSVAFVAIHHPSLGYAPNNWQNRQGRHGNREQYLVQEFGLTPRHMIRNSLHAGWKNPALDSKWFMQVWWFPHTLYGRLFLHIWNRYMEQVASIERDHPYAFVNLDRNPIGGIYKISAFERALESAVKRIGLEYGKIYGTTPHGPRHAYGQRARHGGVDPLITKKLMHHCSMNSQLVYTEPEKREVAAALREATARLNEQNKDKQPVHRADPLPDF